jgi:hypothetical protein
MIRIAIKILCILNVNRLLFTMTVEVDTRVFAIKVTFGALAEKNVCPSLKPAPFTTRVAKIVANAK